VERVLREWLHLRSVFLYFAKLEVVRKVDYTMAGGMYHEHALH
jgi:hypothetical protein